jgi:lipopolysaccharide export system permease protein
VKVIDRHLSGEFLRVFGVSVGAFLLIYLVVDFLEKLRVFTKYGPHARDVLLFFAARVPWMVTQIVPVATLVGTLLSLTLLARHGEVTALRCAGVPLRRLAVPFLACGLALSLATVFVQEVVAPKGFAFAREVWEIRIRKRSPLTLLRAEDLWIRSGSRILHVALAGPEPGVLKGVSVAELEDGRVARRLDAEEARWEEGGWTLKKVVDRSFRPDGSFAVDRREFLRYPLSEGPEDFRFENLEPEEVSWRDLGRRIERYRALGLETRELEVGLWTKTSLPFVSAIMALLAFPFAVAAGRRGSTSFGIVLAVALGFAYWVVLAAGLSLGKSGSLPPALAAWSGNLLFAGVGVVLLLRAEGRG